MRSRTSRRWALSVVLAIGVALSACDGDNAKERDAGDSPAPVVGVAAEIELSSGTASIGAPVTLTAITKVQNTTVQSVRWTLADGRQFDGPTVTASFAGVGQQKVVLEVTTTAGTRAEASGAVFVYDPGAAANPFGFPDEPGDVDGMPGVGVRDALVLAQSLGGVRPLTPDAAAAAFIDLDRFLTERDLALVMTAVLRGASLPSAVLSETAYPGSVVALVSPSLLDPDASVEVRVNDVAALKPMRGLLGYASFIVPTTLAAGTTSARIDLLVDGNIAESFEIRLRQPETLPADPAQDADRFVGEMVALLERQKAAIREELDRSALTADQQQAVLAANDAGITLMKSSGADLQRIFAAPGGERLAFLFQKAMYANGLADFRAEVAATAGGGNVAADKPSSSIAANGGGAAEKLASPEEVCDVLIPATCGLKTVANVIDKGSSIISATCSVVAASAFVGGVVFPADGPLVEASVIGAFVSKCVPLMVAAEVGSYAAWIAAPIDLKLAVAASPPVAGSSQVSAAVSFIGASGVCEELVAKGVESGLNEVVGRAITARLVKNNATVGFLAKVFAAFGEKAFASLLKAINESVSNIVTATGLAEGLQKFVGSVCDSFVGGHGALAVPASRVFKQPAPDDGTLQFNPDGTGIFSCATAAVKPSVTLTGELRLCDRTPAVAKVDVACSARTVTITIGDNGTLLDDIFEVIVNGRSVLTSSVPVRSVSTTVSLPTGLTTIQMRGLAAPDGVGTYFISFTGARVVDGAASGSDLVPGIVKQFTIEVLE